MADVQKLKGDVKWWQDEVRSLEGKLEVARRTLADRERELESAEREEQENKKKAA